MYGRLREIRVVSSVPPGVTTMIVPAGRSAKMSLVLSCWVASRTTSRSTRDSTTAAALVDATAIGTTVPRDNALSASDVAVARECLREDVAGRAG